MPSSPVRVAAVLGLTASLLFLFGCGDDEPATDAASPTPAAAPTSASPSASPTPTPTPKPKQIKASNNFDKITVTGGYGRNRRSGRIALGDRQDQGKVLEPGKGPVVGEGQSVEVNYYGVNGRTGKKFDESFSTGQPVAFSLAQVVPGFSKGLAGQRQGSRVLIAMPGEDGYDPMGGNPQAGIEAGDTLIFVVTW